MSIALSAVFVPDALHSLPLFDEVTRDKALRAVDQLQERGYWVTLASLQNVTHEEKQTCFHWLYTYRTRTQSLPLQPILSCIND
jgi:hypothetical protein